VQLQDAHVRACIAQREVRASLLEASEHIYLHLDELAKSHFLALFSCVWRQAVKLDDSVNVSNVFASGAIGKHHFFDVF